MGWYGFAYNQNGDMVTRETMTRSEKIWFTKASKLVTKNTGSVDGMLQDGSLGCSACGRQVSEILDHPMYNNEEIFSDVITGRMKGIELDGDWASQSAIMFLKGCVKFGYSFRNAW